MTLTAKVKLAEILKDKGELLDAAEIGDNQTIVYMKRPNGEYVTWQYNAYSSTFWGHYFADPVDARTDFLKRIEK